MMLNQNEKKLSAVVFAVISHKAYLSVIEQGCSQMVELEKKILQAFKEELGSCNTFDFVAEISELCYLRPEMIDVF